MTAEGDDEFPADRESPVGEPVVRGNTEIAGQDAEQAVQFDPTDEESLDRAARTISQFASETVGNEDNIYMLRGAAACAALVRGEQSYKAAAERTDGDVSITFIQKWARVHDLPRSIRVHVATGHLAPTAAKHIARVSGAARLDLAWAALDHDLTVREVRAIASTITDGTDPAEALSQHGYTPGACSVELSAEMYRELRRRASRDAVSPGTIVDQALDAHFDQS
jgi:hypothetical protein